LNGDIDLAFAVEGNAVIGRETRSREGDRPGVVGKERSIGLTFKAAQSNKC
jgi:hypothetical protein